MAMRVMHELKLKRIAAVDRPCQEDALAAITKGAERPRYLAKGNDAPELDAAVKEYLGRNPDAAAKAAGVCLPDGSYPIASRSDLKLAVSVLPLAPDFAKARAHLIVKARQIDATSILPASMKSLDLQLLAGVTNDDALAGFEKAVDAHLEDMRKVDFDGVQAEAEAREFANGLLCEIDEAVCSLRQCFYEIADDAETKDKDKALQESLAQFKAHISGIIPEGVENALVAAALLEAGFEISEGGALTKREIDMGATIEMKKSLGLPATATDADVQKALDARTAAATFGENVAKMSPDHLAYMAKAENLATDADRQAFAAKSAGERDEVIKAFPMKDKAKEAADKEKADAEAKKKADDLAKGADETLTIDGQTIRKSVVGEAQFAIFKSMNDKLEKAADEQAISVIAKRAATDLKGISKSADELGILLHGIAKVAPKLATEVETILKAASEQIAKGKLFDEAGRSTTGNSVVGKAAEQITTLAEAEVAKGTFKSIFKAKDHIRQTNPELAKQEAEEGRKAA